MSLDHLVISVPGGPFAALYGTPARDPDSFLAAVRALYEESNATSLEFICVDPNTDAPYTPDLDPHEQGFKRPDYRGDDFTAKLYDRRKLGLGHVLEKNVLLASFHLYCGSYSTNRNGGEWVETPDLGDSTFALVALRRHFGDMEIKANSYNKSERVGKVDERLQRLTITQY